MFIENVLASVAVRDLKAPEKWYQRLFDRPSDAKPMPGLLVWKFNRGGWLQVYQQPERAGAGAFTLIVTGFDDVIRTLASLGLNGERSDGDRVKTVMV